MADTTSSTPRHDIVKLADLAPRAEIGGGAGRRVFGTEPSCTPAVPRAASSPGATETRADTADPERRR